MIFFTTLEYLRKVDKEERIYQYVMCEHRSHDEIELQLLIYINFLREDHGNSRRADEHCIFAFHQHPAVAVRIPYRYISFRDGEEDSDMILLYEGNLFEVLQLLDWFVGINGKR